MHSHRNETFIWNMYTTGLQHMQEKKLIELDKLLVKLCPYIFNIHVTVKLRKCFCW